MLLFIFDFDNTLANTYGPYGEGNIFRTKTLTDITKATEIYEKYRRGPDDIIVYQKLLEEYEITDPKKFFVDAGMEKQLYSDVVPFFQKLRGIDDKQVWIFGSSPKMTGTGSCESTKTVILTTGDEDFQKLKVEITGADKLVDEVVITRNRNKIELIKKIIAKYQPEHTFFIDDRIHMTVADFDTPITIYEMDRRFEKQGPGIIHSLNLALITINYE